jgi:hypothetical protein
MMDVRHWKLRASNCGTGSPRSAAPLPVWRGKKSSPSAEALAADPHQGIATHRDAVAPIKSAYGLVYQAAHILANHEQQTGVQQCLSELVRGWLYGHPSREAAFRWESEESYVR